MIVEKWIEGLARPELKRVAPYISDRDVSEERGLKFADLNENADDLFGNGLNRYPDPQSGALAGKIAGFCNVKQGNVLVFNGSDEAIDILIRVFCRQGKDSVMVLEPTYSMYGICAEANGVEAIRVRLDGDFQPDMKAILAAAKRKKPKLIFACSPNNPTGNLLDFARLGKIARKAKAVLVVDEAYAEFAGKSFARKALRYRNVVVLRTFSKAWALAGARIGYCVASKEMIGLLQKVKLPYNINSLSQKAALGALGRIGMMRECVRKTVRERERLADGLRALGMRVYPSDANFVLFALPAGIDARAVQEKLARKYRILVRDRAGLVQNALRVTVCTQEENDYFLRSLLGAAFDAVLLDIDGTLMDVSQSYALAAKRTAERISKRSVPMRLVREVKSLKGMNNDWDATVEVLRRKGVRSSRKQVVPIFQELYFGRNGNGLVRNERLLVQSGLLRKIGKKIGIVTGRPRAEANAAMARLGMGAGVALVAMEDTRLGKPDAAPLVLAKEMLGAKLAVYIGDSVDDCEAARRAGCAFVAIGDGRARKGEAARFANVNDAIRGLFL